MREPFTTGPFTPEPKTRPSFRRLLSGKKVAIDQEPADWPIAPAAAPTGGLSSAPDHPSRKHDIDSLVPSYVPVESVVAPPGPQPRRRDRPHGRKARS